MKNFPFLVGAAFMTLIVLNGCKNKSNSESVSKAIEIRKYVNQQRVSVNRAFNVALSRDASIREFLSLPGDSKLSSLKNLIFSDSRFALIFKKRLSAFMNDRSAIAGTDRRITAALVSPDDSMKVLVQKLAPLFTHGDMRCGDLEYLDCFFQWFLNVEGYFGNLEHFDINSVGDNPSYKQFIERLVDHVYGY